MRGPADFSVVSSLSTAPASAPPGSGRVPRWSLDAVTALAVGVFGLWEAFERSRSAAGDLFGTDGGAEYVDLFPRLLIAVLMAAAVGTFRWRPASSLVLLCAATSIQVLAPLEVMYVQFGFVAVLYGCARFGSILTAVTAAATIPVALVAAYVTVTRRGLGFLYSLGVGSGVEELAQRSPLIVCLAGLLVLAAPWVTGLSLRLVDNIRAARVREQEAVELRQVAEQQRGQAEDVARLKADQARIARDVHDVVGHSLAVILAQAEAATLLPDEELPRIRAAIAAIATSARESLTDVGAVLGGGSAGPTTGRFPQLISQTATTAPSVVTVTRGTPRTLAPDLDVVAERVLREMITNAIKHGAEASPIDLVVYWGQALEISVTNVVGDRSVPGSGQGLAGMRSRLEAVGGSLVVDTYEGTFRVVARIPLPVV